MKASAKRAISATLLKIIFASSRVIGETSVDPLDESDAVDSVREDEPDDGGVAGVAWKGAGWPAKN